MTMRKTMRTALILPLALLAVAGCFRLSRDTPPLEQFVLGGTAAASTAAASADPTGVTIGVRRLDLASYLATPAVVIRRGAHQIEHSEFHRWAEDPGEGITRAVAGYLAAEPSIRAVDVAPWAAGSRHDYLVQLHIARFEGVAPADSGAVDGEAHLLATWEIIRPVDAAVLARGTTEHREGGWTVGDYAGLVTSLDRGLSGLATDLGMCVGQLASAPVGTGEAEARPDPVMCSVRMDREP
jgi:uncharacterized lipoprotein YmbA